MKLIIAEKNDAARQIAERLSTGKPKKDKVYNTAIYRFEWKGEECVTIGLAGHILAPDFCDSVLFDKKLGWYSVTEDGEMLPADIPDGLARPPYDTKRKPFLADGISIKGWKLESLPYLTWAPVIKLPAEKELIRSLKNLAKKSDSVIIATDFDREGELIGSDALNKVREVAPDLPVARAQYSSFTKAEITQAFDNLVSLDQNLADAGESRQHIDLIWGAVLTRYLTLAKFGGFGNVRSAGRVTRAATAATGWPSGWPPPWWSSASASAWRLCPRTIGRSVAWAPRRVLPRTTALRLRTRRHALPTRILPRQRTATLTALRRRPLPR